MRRRSIKVSKDQILLKLSLSDLYIESCGEHLYGGSFDNVVFLNLNLVPAFYNKLKSDVFFTKDDTKRFLHFEGAKFEVDYYQLKLGEIQEYVVVVMKKEIALDWIEAVLKLWRTAEDSEQKEQSPVPTKPEICFREPIYKDKGDFMITYQGAIFQYESWANLGIELVIERIFRQGKMSMDDLEYFEQKKYLMSENMSNN